MSRRVSLPVRMPKRPLMACSVPPSTAAAMAAGLAATVANTAPEASVTPVTTATFASQTTSVSRTTSVSQTTTATLNQTTSTFRPLAPRFPPLAPTFPPLASTFPPLAPTFPRLAPAFQQTPAIMPTPDVPADFLSSMSPYGREVHLVLTTLCQEWPGKDYSFFISNFDLSESSLGFIKSTLMGSKWVNPRDVVFKYGPIYVEAIPVGDRALYREYDTSNEYLGVWSIVSIPGFGRELVNRGNLLDNYISSRTANEPNKDLVLKKVRSSRGFQLFELKEDIRVFRENDILFIKSLDGRYEKYVPSKTDYDSYIYDLNGYIWFKDKKGGFHKTPFKMLKSQGGTVYNKREITVVEHIAGRGTKKYNVGNNNIYSSTELKNNIESKSLK